MSTSAVGRPARVTIVAVVVFLQGLITLIAGIGLVVERNNASLLEHVDQSSSTIATYGWIAVVWGALALLVAWGLFGGASWSRILVGILQFATVAGGVYLLFGWDGHYRWQGIEQIAVALVVLWMLFSARADAFFEGRRA